MNTTVAAIQAELDQARYYLDNTLMVAPEDGYIMNLQVRPGMVAGDVRFGAIASFICDADRYLLANYFQENLKYVKPGQAVEVALDLYPGQILPGKVRRSGRAAARARCCRAARCRTSTTCRAEVPQGQFAVAITLDDADQSKFPIGTQGRAAIYTNPDSGFVVLAQDRDPRVHLVQLAVSVLRLMRAARARAAVAAAAGRRLRAEDAADAHRGRGRRRCRRQRAFRRRGGRCRAAAT